MTELYVVERHHELLHLWRRQKVKDIDLVHVDFHDDLRGLVIDHRRCKAYRKRLFGLSSAPLDEGNFLMYAIEEGILNRIRWVHGPVGGRAYDLGIVKYEGDISAYPYRIAHFLRRDMEFAVDFQEILVDEWGGCDENQHLDIDWDCFAAIDLDSAGIRSRFESFMKKVGEHSPPVIYLCYSPGYVHPSQSEFLVALEQLAKRYDAEPFWLNPSFLDDAPVVRPETPPLSLGQKIISQMRRKGIY